MSETNASIREALKLLHQIRDHLKRHQQWSKSDAELKHLIADLEAVLTKSHGAIDVLRVCEMLLRAAILIVTLLNLK